MSDTTYFDRFTKCAVDVLAVKPEQVKPEARFDTDLEADSLDLVELVMALEEEFGIKVEEDELAGIETVNAAFELVTSKIDAGEEDEKEEAAS